MVLLNGRDEVLVFRHIGERRSYWVLPGGEVGEGESWVEAAAREMWEERGISGVPIGPLLWTRRAPGHQNSQALISDERDDLVRCGMQEVTNARQLAEEKRISTRNQWWSPAAIQALRDRFHLERLADLLLSAVENQISPSPLSRPKSSRPGLSGPSH